MHTKATFFQVGQCVRGEWEENAGDSSYDSHGSTVPFQQGVCGCDRKSGKRGRTLGDSYLSVGKSNVHDDMQYRRYAALVEGVYCRNMCRSRDMQQFGRGHLARADVVLVK